MASKSTNAVVQRRVNQVYDMLLCGASRAEIIEYSIQKEWGIVDKTIDLYIKKANLRFKEQSNVIHDEQFGLAINRLNNLYMKCMKIQDYKAALAVQKDLNALLGLYKPSKKELRWDNAQLESMDFAKQTLRSKLAQVSLQTVGEVDE